MVKNCRLSKSHLIRSAIQKDEDIIVGMSLILVSPISAIKGVHDTYIVGSNVMPKKLKMILNETQNFGNKTTQVV